MACYCQLAATVDVSGHLNLLLLLGIAVFFGTAGARLFQKLRIPQVVGYIVIGLILGGSALKLIGIELVMDLSPLNMFALGIIGFTIGGELKLDIFRRYGRQFIVILVSEGVFAFIAVGLLTGIGTYHFTHNLNQSIALGVLLGAISSATAPAATVDVLWEYKTRGILTKTILAIVAMDDGLALLLYGFAGSLATVLTGGGHGSWAMNLLMPFWEILGAVVLGLGIGLILVFLAKHIEDSEKVLAFALSSILLGVGLSVVLQVESILTAMVLGATLANFLPRRSKDVFEVVGKFSPPIYVLFFVLVGARLQISSIPTWIIILAVIYVFGRTMGKISGAWFGSYVSKAPEQVRKYLGLCLFSQAGVAIGLSILASERFGGSIGEAIILIVTSTTFLVQIIGPPFVKLGVKKAGEIGMNITEEDLIKTYKVSDVMDTEHIGIQEDTSISEIIKIFGRTKSFYYPMLDKNNNVTGAMTIDSIRNTFANQELNNWLVAMDIAEPIVAKVTPQAPLSEAFETAKRFDIEHLTVVSSDDEKKFVGVLNCHAVQRQLSAEVLSRQEKADKIHSV
jgi:Kef-type K+ transport system membrane component KefB/predicted transcriptional regulator